MGRKGEGVCPHCKKLTPEGTKPDIQVGVSITEIEAGFEKMKEHVADLEHAKDGLAVAASVNSALGKMVYPKRFIERFETDVKKSLEAIEMYRRNIGYAIEIIRLACVSNGHNHTNEQEGQLIDLPGGGKVMVVTHPVCHDNQIAKAWKAWLADIEARLMSESIGKAATPPTPAPEAPTTFTPGKKFNPEASKPTPPAKISDIEGPPF